MKLIFCPHCSSVFNLTYKLKRCLCRKSYGKYIDKNNVRISKSAIALCFHNEYLIIAYQKYKSAMKSKTSKRWATPLKAWIMIEKNCTKVKKI